MAFNETLRVLYDSSTDHLNKLVVAQLAALDAEAAGIRQANDLASKENRRRDIVHPADALREKAQQLFSAVEIARAETISAIDGQVIQLREAWEKERDLHPERVLAQIRLSENKFKGMSDTEVQELAILYASDAADLDYCELNELKGRLRVQGAEAESKTLDAGISNRHGNSPWISENEEARDLVGYRDKLAELHGSQVLYSGDQGEAVLDLTDLIDYSGELANAG